VSPRVRLPANNRPWQPWTSTSMIFLSCTNAAPAATSYAGRVDLHRQSPASARAQQSGLTERTCNCTEITKRRRLLVKQEMHSQMRRGLGGSHAHPSSLLPRLALQSTAVATTAAQAARNIQMASAPWGLPLPVPGSARDSRPLLGSSARAQRRRQTSRAL
jgi:hypothetical protein